VAEHVLQPLLVELGALVPVRAFAATERQLDDLDAVIQAWVEEADPVLSRLAGVGTTAA
jgi:FMN reductase